jgi:hypothetical protein
MDVQSVLLTSMHFQSARFFIDAAALARPGVLAGRNNNRANNNANQWRAGA